MSTQPRARSRSRRRDEHGAMAVIVALLSVSLLMMAAMGVDIAQQVSAKHNVQNDLDSAATAGAYRLDQSANSAAQAKADALKFAAVNAPAGAPAPFVDFWCIVGATGNAPNYTPDTTQIPTTCTPGTAPYTVAKYPKLVCSALLCAIPCDVTQQPTAICNTIRLTEARDVPFHFAPAGGIQKGSTGSVISVACKGSCGTVAPNPMDVTVVADRTGSMSDTDIASMVSGIKSMLGVMSPGQQYVSLGTIGRSMTTTRSTAACTSTGKGLSYPSSSATTGQWVPLQFYNDYTSGGVANANSNLVKAVNCLTTSSGTGTSLAAPMKAAARYLLGKDTNNLSSLPARAGTVRKVLIFETDGQPNEEGPTGGSASLDTTSDLFSNSTDVDTVGPVTTQQATTGTRTISKVKYTDTYNTTTKTTTLTEVGGENACANLKAVADNAKAAGILVITIAYNLSGYDCGDGDNPKPAPTAGSTTVISNITPSDAKTTTNGVISLNTSYKGNATITQTTTTTVVNQAADPAVTDTLAAVASKTDNGAASTANNDCSTTAGRNTENSDGDYFFCAATGTDMASIFKTALSQASSGIKLLNLPGS